METLDLANNILSYSLDGEINRMLLYSSLNDVNIFVEDKDKEFEYETIFQRLLGNDVKIKTIFGVGGKRNLEEAYNILKNKYNCKNIFLADGDFDRILNKPMIKDEIFIYLDKYCIENYIIDEEATICFIQGRLGKPKNETKRIINFPNWYKKITNGFYDLIVLFLIVQDKGLGIPNTGQSGCSFLKDRSWEVDSKRINDYYEQVKSMLPDVDEQIKIMQSTVSKEVGNDISSLITGKYYFDSLKKYLLNFTSKSVNDKDLRNFLFNHFEISKLSSLRDAIIKVCNTNSQAC